jgi:hypothetical protein
MIHNIAHKTKLKKFDNYIRQIKNENLIIHLSWNLFCISWEYGGLWMKNLVERYVICKFNNIVYFIFRQNETREFITCQIVRKADLRKIAMIKNNDFSIYNDPEDRHLKSDYHSSISKFYSAACHMNIDINFDQDKWAINVWTHEIRLLKKCKRVKL